MAFGEMFGE